MDLSEYLTSDATTLAGLVAEQGGHRRRAARPGAGASRRGQPDDQRRRRAADRGRGRPGGRPGPRRSLRRRALPGEGPRAGVRRLPDVQRLPSPGHRRRHRACAGDPALPRRRAGHLRQDEHPGVRREGGHRARAVGRGPQPLEHRPHARRFVGRVRRRGRRGHRAGGGRQRRRRIGPDPGGLQRPGGPQDQPRRRPLRPADRRGDVRDGDPGRGLPHRAGQRRPAGRDHRSRPGRRLPGRAAAGAVRRGSSRGAPGTLRIGYSSLVRDQRQPGPRGGRRGRVRRGPARPSWATRSRRSRRRTTTRRWPGTSSRSGSPSCTARSPT